MFKVPTLFCSLVVLFMKPNPIRYMPLCYLGPNSGKSKFIKVTHENFFELILILLAYILKTLDIIQNIGGISDFLNNF